MIESDVIRNLAEEYGRLELSVDGIIAIMDTVIDQIEIVRSNGRKEDCSSYSNIYFRALNLARYFLTEKQIEESKKRYFKSLNPDAHSKVEAQTPEMVAAA